MMENIVLTAGGTGGHLFPAKSLACELADRGFSVNLITDDRAKKLGEGFPAQSVHVVDSETIRGRSPLSILRTALYLYRGYRQSLRILKRIAPKVVAGFGGYPTIPPVVAARRIGIPTVLHEANTVMGRANRFLSKRASAVAVSFPNVGMDDQTRIKPIRTGNPLRAEVIEAGRLPYHAPDKKGRCRVLVFGGSQGARFLSQIVPVAIGLLPEALRHRIDLVQQCREEDLKEVAAEYSTHGMECELSVFFDDMPQRIAQAHLVICRSGAMTVSELAAIGRPSILIPLPGTLDGDQIGNARTLESIGGAVLLEQESISADDLAKRINDILDAPEFLSEMAAKAKLLGRNDATKRLADLVELVARGGKVAEFEGGVEA